MYIVVFIIIIFIIVCIIGSKTEKQETIPIKSERSKLQEFENHFPFKSAPQVFPLPLEGTKIGQKVPIYYI